MEFVGFTITKKIFTGVKDVKSSQLWLCRGVISEKIEFQIGMSDFSAWILNRVSPNKRQALN
jgi:hypothetical protein